MRTSPLLAELDRTYAAKGFRIVGLNADRVLEIPTTDEDRAAYAKKNGWTFTLAHMTPEAQEAYGTVSVFPTLFFVDRKGMVVKQFVNFQEKAALEAAIRRLCSRPSTGPSTTPSRRLSRRHSRKDSRKTRGRRLWILRARLSGALRMTGRSQACR